MVQSLNLMMMIMTMTMIKKTTILINQECLIIFKMNLKNFLMSNIILKILIKAKIKVMSLLMTINSGSLIAITIMLIIIAIRKKLGKMKVFRIIKMKIFNKKTKNILTMKIILTIYSSIPRIIFSLAILIQKTSN